MAHHSMITFYSSIETLEYKCKVSKKYGSMRPPSPVKIKFDTPVFDSSQE